MATFEWIILLLLGAALLAALARQVGAPYPTFLALGGALLAFVPASPQWTLDPQLALALFVAPVLLDAAYDTSLRDLRRNWRPVAGLVVAAVGTTVIAVALAARWLVPGMSWPVAISLGAIVAPPDAAASIAVMRQVKLPHRLLKILEGESLLNDASALLVYRLAIMTVLAGHLGFASFAPVFLLTVFGSLAAGVACAFVLRPLTSGFHDVPILLILQFTCTFGVWIGAEAIGLSGILTLVAYAMTVARSGGMQMPARVRVPIFAVWETVVFVLNAFAFVLIGLQLRPILQRLDADGGRAGALATAAVVLGVTVAARFAWVMSYTMLMRLRSGRDGEPAPRPAIGGGIIVGWAGMRGIVTLAAAFAIPEALPDGAPFPYRDLYPPVRLRGRARHARPARPDAEAADPPRRPRRRRHREERGPSRPHPGLRRADRCDPRRRHAGRQAAAQGVRRGRRAQRQPGRRRAGRRSSRRPAAAPRHRCRTPACVRVAPRRRDRRRRLSRAGAGARLGRVERGRWTDGLTP
jgi:CPA1 family monovalent cation:H+ antiporter